MCARSSRGGRAQHPTGGFRPASLVGALGEVAAHMFLELLANEAALCKCRRDDEVLLRLPQPSEESLFALGKFVPFVREILERISRSCISAYRLP